MNQPAPPAPDAPTLILLRHGETVGQSSIRLHGATDVALSAVGEQQAERAAAALAALPIARALCSPLQRARKTAEIVLAARTAAPTTSAIDAPAGVARSSKTSRSEGVVGGRVREGEWGRDGREEAGEPPDPSAVAGAAAAGATAPTESAKSAGFPAIGAGTTAAGVDSAGFAG